MPFRIGGSGFRDFRARGLGTYGSGLLLLYLSGLQGLGVLGLLGSFGLDGFPDVGAMYSGIGSSLWGLGCRVSRLRLLFLLCQMLWGVVSTSASAS